MILVRTIANTLLLGVLATALPQGTEPATTQSATSDEVSTTTSPAASSRSITPSPSPSPTSTLSAHSRSFVGWSSSSTRSGTTRYVSAYCPRSSIYVTSTIDGTTYAGCCDTRSGNNCATTSLAMYCVNIVQMAGNRTISDCGSSTCAHAVIYQSVGDEDRGSESISFHHCAYYGSRGGTYYRALPTTNATTRPFTTGSSSSSSSSQNDDEGWRPQRVGAAVAGTIIAFLIICVVIPVCICSAVRKKGRGLAAGRHTGNRPHTFQPVPPTVTASPEYHRGGEVGAPTHSTLDPGRSTPWFALPQWDANADGRPPKPNANWGQEMQGLPPRYEEIGGTRVVR